MDTDQNLTDLVAELLLWHATVSPILQHMKRWSPHSSPDALPINDTLAQLLSDTLRPITERHAPQELATTTAILTECRTTVGEEIFLVPRPIPRHSRQRGHRER